MCNFCPVLRENYRIGVPYRGKYTPVLSSDDKKYGGLGTALTAVTSEDVPMHGYLQSVELTVPPMSTVFYTVEKKRVAGTKKKAEGAVKAKKAPASKTAAKKSSAEQKKANPTPKVANASDKKKVPAKAETGNLDEKKAAKKSRKK